MGNNFEIQYKDGIMTEIGFFYVGFENNGLSIWKNSMTDAKLMKLRQKITI